MDAATLAARITTTENAIDALMTGQRVVRITGPNGSEVEYQQSNLADLQKYLLFLKSQDPTQARKPIFFEFGR